MDPIRTAVKFSLIPFRAVVRLGDALIDSSQEEPPREQPQPRKRGRTQKRTKPRRKTPGPQASQAPKDLDDVAVARKVETIIFRDHSVPKGKIDVNVADGVVWIRGEAKSPEMIRTIEAQATAIPEVKRVENLLHLPKTPARRPEPKRDQAPRKVETGITNERRTTHGEELPIELAEEGEGRQPAPLGSHEGTS